MKQEWCAGYDAAWRGDDRISPHRLHTDMRKHWFEGYDFAYAKLAYHYTPNADFTNREKDYRDR